MLTSARNWHVIKPNHTTRAPKRVVFFDCESNMTQEGDCNETTIHTLRLWTANAVSLKHGKIYHIEKRAGKTASEFWDWLVPQCLKRGSTWIYSHNLAFDLTLVNFWDIVIRGSGSLEWFCVEDPPSIFKCTIAGKKLIVADTLNYWKVPLASIGESICCPKMPMPSYPSTNADWEDYCWNDTEIITRAVCGLIYEWQERDWGNWSATASGLAWNCYRHHFMKQKITVHPMVETLALERKCYHGGRCQPFKIGSFNSKITEVDVNSLYPYSMISSPQPCKLVSSVENQRIGFSDAIEKGLFCCATARIRSKYDEYPVFYNERLRFASGSFVSSICGEELKRAVANDELVQVYEFSAYETADLFSEYVSSMNALKIKARNEGDIANYSLYKLLLNSLYGKFGQSSGEWQDCHGEVPLHPYGKWWKANAGAPGYKLIRSIGWHLQHKIGEKEWYNSFPAIPASVTSYARSYMDQSRKIVGLENIYYMDTDSIHVNEIGFNNLKYHEMINETMIGLFKKVRSENFAEYRGWKDYTLGKKMVKSGLKRNAEPLGDGIYLQENFEGMSSVLESTPKNSISSHKVKIDLSKSQNVFHADSSGNVQRLILKD